MRHSSVDRSGASHGSLKSYSIGFILSIFLTVLAFGAVMAGGASRSTILYIIIGAAVAQILVHLHYFLHLNGASESRWNVLALLLTLLIMLLFVAGSLWIMYNLTHRLM